MTDLDPDGSEEEELGEKTLETLGASLANLSSGLLQRQAVNNNNNDADDKSNLPLYGALKAVEGILGPVEIDTECPIAMPFSWDGSLDDDLLFDMMSDHGAEGSTKSMQAGMGFHPERDWRNLPSGGEAAFAKPAANVPLRLQVAHVQNKLSDTHNALTMCLDVLAVEEKGDSTSIFMDDKRSYDELWQNTCDFAQKAKEASAMEAEAVALAKRKEAMVQQLETLRQETKQVQAETDSLCKAAAEKRGRRKSVQGAHGRGVRFSHTVAQAKKAQDLKDETERTKLNSAMQLLVCLKDVALNHRDKILPEEYTHMTSSQKAVACFLDEASHASRPA